MNGLIYLSKVGMIYPSSIEATSRTLQDFGQNPENGLGGNIGFIAF